LSFSVASVIMDRALGTTAILLLGVVSVLLAPPLAIPGLIPIFAAGSLACAALALVVFSGRATDLMSRAVAKFRSPHLTGLADRLLAAIREYRHHHRALVVVLMASIGVQVLRVLQAYFLGVALGISAPLWSYFVAIPIVLLVMLLPAFALSVLFVALGVVGNLPGGLLYASGGLPRHAS
jgi:hypothetical protein